MLWCLGFELVLVRGLGASPAKDCAPAPGEEIHSASIRRFRRTPVFYGDAGTLEPGLEDDVGTQASAGACGEGYSTAVRWCGRLAWLEKVVRQ